jgi:6-phosphofructokinase 2
MKRIVTLTLNPAIDGAAEAEQVRPIRKIRTWAERYDPGGGGINAARVIEELGGSVLAVYLSGGATGPILDDLVQASGIESRRIPTAGHTRVSHTVHETSTGLEFRFVPEGPSVTKAEWQACLSVLEGIDGDYLLASGSLPRGVPADFYAQVAAVAARKDMRFVLDTSGEALRQAAGKGLYLIKPSLGELEDLIGRKLSTPPDQASAVRDLIAAGAAQIIALTLGRDGAVLATRDPRHAPADRGREGHTEERRRCRRQFPRRDDARSCPGKACGKGLPPGHGSWNRRGSDSGNGTVPAGRCRASLRTNHTRKREGPGLSTAGLALLCGPLRIVRPAQEGQKQVRAADDADDAAVVDNRNPLHVVPLHRIDDLGQRRFDAGRDGILRHDVFDAAAAQIADGVGPTVEEGLDPAHAIASLAPQEVAFRHDADQRSAFIHDGKAADAVLDHEAGRLGERGARLDRCSPRRHHVASFHRALLSSLWSGAWPVCLSFRPHYRWIAGLPDQA